MACPHVSGDLAPPHPSVSVYREDCTQCFDSIDDEDGLNVCLHCFNGGCGGQNNHGLIHHGSTGHPLVVNIKRTRKHIQRDEPPAKLTKLAIAAETEEDRYDTKTQVNCYECELDNIDLALGKLKSVVDGIMNAMTFARKEEVKAWEQEFTPCEHTLCLEQQPRKKIASQDLGQCSMCDLKENLWLCLECGNLACGRAQFGGVGGNSHGLAHAKESGHGVAVKLGSITPEGNADIYCYKCDEERIDPELPNHLAHWGINIADREKTEKSLMEMQVEQNLKWDFSMTTDDGKELQPLFGPGFTGMKNIGNSCYLASTVQCLFNIPEFEERYHVGTVPPPEAAAPAEDLETQLRKLGDGLLSGKYSYPEQDIHVEPDNPEVPHQKGLSPAMFKHLVGRGHEEFSTMRQQDAFEFLLHLFKLISVSNRSSPAQDPTESFRFVMEQRLSCLNCKKVRYRTDEQDNISIPVPVRRKPALVSSQSEDAKSKRSEFEAVSLRECLDIFTAADTVELTCPGCGSKSGFTKSSRFKTFPKNLVVNARRFELVNWVPTKLDIPVQVGDEPFDLSKYMSHGLQSDEEELPEDADVGSSGFIPNEAALGSLEAMGFPRVRCEKALHATGNSDPEAAMNWLFAHMDDPDIDDPVNLGGAANADETSGDADKIAQLGDMGISAPQARKALRECGGDVNRALDWVFSHPDDQGDFDEGPIEAQATPKRLPGSTETPAMFELESIACHKGASIHAGHYVAFIRKPIPAGSTNSAERSWVLFNDEKVVKAADIDEMKKYAYVYFFRRQ